MTEEQIREIQIQKEHVRQKIRLLRSSLTDDHMSDASVKISEYVLSSEEFQKADSVFCYVSMNGEPSTQRILQETLARGKKLYVPKCLSNHRMLAVRVHTLDELVPGKFSIPEPPTADECAAPGEIDLIIVPCVSMSPDRIRLGHGAGYYDRFLSGISGTPVTFCLCFSSLICSDIPEEPSDIRMNRGVSEEGFF